MEEVHGEVIMVVDTKVVLQTIILIKVLREGLKVAISKGAIGVAPAALVLTPVTEGNNQSLNAKLPLQLGRQGKYIQPNLRIAQIHLSIQNLVLLTD